mgnify:CR=1 FL=1
MFHVKRFGIGYGIVYGIVNRIGYGSANGTVFGSDAGEAIQNADPTGIRNHKMKLNWGLRSFWTIWNDRYLGGRERGS